ncbi:SRPBCC family protein [Belnapia rosea]|uniref:SRPBCC family protein n=1 Tax=Belnapia rosea TaxID=938405 RepID=UPI00087F865D|nr:SRPBCC family protein [Belnapia rosea]SDB74953.1 Carbon monoxide dehydrogenase subunit G [Belnapia rosea]
MNVSEQTRIPSPLAEVWPLLSDPATVSRCIPGAQLAPDQGDGVWRGSIRVRFGPTAAVFRGEATLAYDREAHRCTIEARGIDQRGASRALSSGSIVAEDEADATLLTVSGSFTVTGPLETFANAGGVHLARALLAEFSTNVAKLVEAHRAAAPAAKPTTVAAAEIAPLPPVPEPAKAPAPEISAVRLLWQALRSWLRSLFGNKGER